MKGETIAIIGIGIVAFLLITKNASGASVYDLSYLDSGFDSSDVNRLQALADELVGRGLSDQQIRFMLSQALHETGLFTDSPNYNAVDNKHNFAGISRNGSISIYGSISDFVTDWLRVLNLGPNHPIEATSISDFASRLKSNGYYEDSLSNYSAAINYYYNLLT